MSFIMQETAGVMGASAATGALAGEMSGHGAQAGMAGAVVPPGLEEISAANAARVAAYAAEATAILEASSTVHGMYGASTGTSAAISTLTDALNAAGLGNLL